MTPGQVRGYLAFIDRVAAGGRVYLKQWATWHDPDDGVTMRLSEYPVPSAWIPTLREAAAVRERFVQAGWLVPHPSEAETS